MKVYAKKAGSPTSAHRRGAGRLRSYYSPSAAANIMGQVLTPSGRRRGGNPLGQYTAPHARRISRLLGWG